MVIQDSNDTHLIISGAYTKYGGKGISGQLATKHCKLEQDLSQDSLLKQIIYIAVKLLVYQSDQHSTTHTVSGIDSIK